ncbi:MAG: hypothetical protein GXO79_12160 [Chlorobi bacterium]|nr:hypothetical protein [Chlorobiota bacterium]
MKLSYLTKILLFSIIIALLTFIASKTGLDKYYLNIYPYVILFFFLTGILFHTIILKLSKKNISKFSTYYMLSSTLKLLSYIIFMVIYLIFNKEDAISFVLYFFILYALYTAFEVLLVLPEIKKKE